MSEQRLPQHKNPTYSDDPRFSREALAPYNFVPLPERVVPAEEQEPLNQSRYHADRFTGRIVCRMTTESPLFVRCGITVEQLVAGLEAKNLPDFFFTASPDTPVIPGSSLRGMLRSLVEIAAYSKLNRITDRKLFYRSLNDRAIYTDFFVRTIAGVTDGVNLRANCYESLVRAGFLRRRTEGYVIEEVGYGRVDLGAEHQRYYTGRGPGMLPDWKFQHKEVYVEVEAAPSYHFFRQQLRPNGQVRHPNLYLRFRKVQRMEQQPAPGLQRGTLVITGNMQHKHLEFVLLPNEQLGAHSIPDEMVRRFEDDDQVTQWQEQAFPRDRPQPGSRRRDGGLRDGEPVFFLVEDGSVRFFGRAQLFRLPYRFSPRDFVPENLRDDRVDLAEAIFGFVRSQQMGQKEQVRAGRVFVADAIPAPGQGDMRLSPEPITPHILASPKPTTYQHYLVQPSPDGGRLRHYASEPGEETVIRGHKLYWHKGPEPAIAMSPDERRDASDTQLTTMRPVRAGVNFSFTIYVENLSQVELGALLWVLRLGGDPAYRLKLGMGKPLGMGAVRLKHTVFKSWRVRRYERLFEESGASWDSGEAEFSAAEQDTAVEAFETYVLEHSGEGARYAQLADTLRIRCLLALLSWPGPLPEKTRYMEIERPEDHPGGYRRGARPNNRGKVNEYADRPVLPLPTQVSGVSSNTAAPGKGQPTRSNERPARPEPTPPPASPKIAPQLPAVGEVFTGLVLERDEEFALIAVPGFTREQAIAMLKIEPDTPRWKAGRDKARVEVIGQREREGLVILRVKRNAPAPKPREGQP